MKTFLRCIPCFVRHGYDVASRVTDDQAKQELVMREVMKLLVDIDMSKTPPEMAREVHRVIREITGVADPYLAEKQYFNELVLGMYDELAAKIDNAADPLEMAIRLVIAGNVIDFGAHGAMDAAGLAAALDHAMETELDADLPAFENAIKEADSILYVCDNAGEIVFDKLLIERIGPARITVAVRGAPILNDVTRADADAVGLSEIVRVIDNGYDAPGTVLSAASDEFRQAFEAADMVIAKGQGNYETLSEADREVYLLLKAKCPVIAEHIGCGLGDLILLRGGRKSD